MNEKINNLIKGKSILGCILAIPILVSINSIGLEGFIFMGALPLALLIAFGITKKPIFGTCYTILYIITRWSVLINGLLLAAAITWITLVYFVYVDIRVWKGFKEKVEDVRECQ